MQTKKWLLGASAMLGMYIIPVCAEPNQMEEYYQSLIEVGYYYAEISISKPQCFSPCKNEDEIAEKTDSTNIKVQKATTKPQSSLNTKTKAKNSNKTSSNSNSSLPINQNKESVKAIETNSSTKVNSTNTKASTSKENDGKVNNLNTTFSTDNQEDIIIRNINKPNEIDAKSSAIVSKEGLHFIVYKEWQANKSNIFIKQIANINNKETTILKAFYTLTKNDFYYKQTDNRTYNENNEFFERFPFFNLAYPDFMYYLYKFKKIKENDDDVFFNATLKRTPFIEEDYLLLLSPSIRVKYSKKFNIPVKFVFFNKANKAIGEINVTKVDQVGKRFYAVAYNMVNMNHEQSTVNIDNILIGLSLGIESDSKLNLDEYKGLTQETLMYENN